MSAEDYVDAFEKLLRLGLSGKQACINVRLVVVHVFDNIIDVCLFLCLICRTEKL